MEFLGHFFDQTGRLWVTSMYESMVKAQRICFSSLKSALIVVSSAVIGRVKTSSTNHFLLQMFSSFSFFVLFLFRGPNIFFVQIFVFFLPVLLLLRWPNIFFLFFICSSLPPQIYIFLEPTGQKKPRFKVNPPSCCELS